MSAVDRLQRVKRRKRRTGGQDVIELAEAELLVRLARVNEPSEHGHVDARDAAEDDGEVPARRRGSRRPTRDGRMQRPGDALGLLPGGRERDVELAGLSRLPFAVFLGWKVPADRRESVLLSVL